MIADTDRGRALGNYQLQKPCGCQLSSKKQTLAQFEAWQYSIFSRSPRCMHQVLDPPVVLGRDNHCTDHCGAAAKIHQSADPPTASISPAAITHLSDEILLGLPVTDINLSAHPEAYLPWMWQVLSDVSAPPFAGQPGSRVFTLMPQKGHQSCYITITSDCLHRQVVYFVWCPTSEFLSKCTCACIKFAEPKFCQPQALHCQTVV